MVKQSGSGFYWELFKSTFLISAFTVGGGFVIIPLLKAKFVDQYKWLEDKEALDLVSVAQTAPGVVAVNASVIMGYRMAGWRGMLTALLATVLPPLITISVIAYCYEYVVDNNIVRFLLEGMQCGATAIIIDVAARLLCKEVGKRLALPLVIMAGTFITNYVLGWNIMYVILFNAVLGCLAMQDAKYD